MYIKLYNIYQFAMNRRVCLAKMNVEHFLEGSFIEVKSLNSSTYPLATVALAY